MILIALTILLTPIVRLLLHYSLSDDALSRWLSDMPMTLLVQVMMMVSGFVLAYAVVG